MKKLLKKIIALSGYSIIKNKPATTGSNYRPVGDMRYLLEDLKHRGIKCNFVLDVGANSGGWSRMAKSVFHTAGFGLIEPQEEMASQLEAFCNQYSDCIYFLAGAGAYEDVATFTVWDDHAGSAILPERDLKEQKSRVQRSIKILTIDALIETGKIPVPEIIKLDIQGYELEALKGASRTFGITEVYILEVSLFKTHSEIPLIADVINFMLARGYVVYDFPGFLRRPYDGALGQCDICFVKESGVLRNYHSWE
jgi:FkbM family methyltransferase